MFMRLTSVLVGLFFFYLGQGGVKQSGLHQTQKLSTAKRNYQQNEKKFTEWKEYIREQDI